MTFDELERRDAKGREYAVSNARIESVSISNEDHGCLTAWVNLRWSSSGCGFGGFKLGNAGGGNLDEKGFCAEFINRCIRVGIGEYGKWEDLEGKPVRILHEGWGGKVVAVGHYLDDEWFCPRQEWRKEK